MIYALKKFFDTNYNVKTNILNSLKTKRVLIFGTPSIESQKYASRLPKLGHINSKNKTELKK